MRLSHHKIIGLVIAIVAVGTIMYFSLNHQEIFGFKLLSFNNVAISDITCYVKTESRLNKGDTYRETHSSFLIKSPITTFNVIDKIGRVDTVDKITVLPKIRCDLQNDGKTSSQVSLVIEKTQLNLEVLSQNSKKDKVVTATQSMNTNEIKLVDNKEVTLGTFTVPIEDMTQDLDGGNYESYQEIKVSGNLKFHYENYPTVKYSINVPNDSIRTYFLVTIQNVENPPPPPYKNTCPTGQVLTYDDKTKLYSCIQKEVPTKDDNTEKTTTTDDKTPDNPDLWTSFQSCIMSEDKSCLNSVTYFPFYFIGFLLVIAIVISNRRGRQVMVESQ